MAKKTKEQFIKDARLVHGDKYDYSKVEYINNKTAVTIICPIHGEFKQRPDMHIAKKNGCRLCRSDKMKKRLYGVAYFDGYNKRCDAYMHWRNMLERCYHPKCVKHKFYQDCSVCDEWLLFSNFKKWFDEQTKEKGWQLDKDILVKGNKVYSPSTCCFVPQEVNTMLKNRSKERKQKHLPNIYKQQSGNFLVTGSSEGVTYNLGTYHTQEEAFDVFKKFRETSIKRVADKFKGIIDMNVYEALYNYKVEIDD